MNPSGLVRLDSFGGESVQAAVAPTAVVKEHLQLIVSRRGRHYLHDFEFNPNEDVMEKLLEKINQVNLFHGRLDKILFFKSFVVEIATLPQTSIGDLEAQRLPREVFIESSSHHQLLTNSIRRCEVLSVTARAAALSLALGEEPAAQRALLIKQEINVQGWLSAMSLLLVVPLAAGLIIGLATSSAQMGIATTSAVTAVVGILEGFLFWIFR